MIDIVIIFFISAALFLSIQPSDKIRAYASIIGLLGQPVCIYAMHTAEEWGMLAVSIACTASWSVGFKRYWLSKSFILRSLVQAIMGFVILISINLLMHKTISTLDYLIAILAGGAILLTQIPSPVAQRYAPLLGLSGQPFCFYAMFVSGEIGMFIVTLITTLLWGWGAFIHWKSNENIRFLFNLSDHK